jgi:hypothetical protein
MNHRLRIELWKVERRDLLDRGRLRGLAGKDRYQRCRHQNSQYYTPGCTSSLHRGVHAHTPGFRFL